MSHETWRLLIDEPAGGAANMARDEAILAGQAAESSAPTLRLYRWRPACLSLGRFQRGDAVDREACRRTGVAVVRRPSGGRALLHDQELTYAVAVRADHPLLGGESILATYRRISQALVVGLRRLGVAAELTPTTKGQRPKDPRPKTQDRRPNDREPKTEDQMTEDQMTEDPRPKAEGETRLVLGPSSLVTGPSSLVTRPPSSVTGLSSFNSAACFDAPASYELTVSGRKLVGSAQVRGDGGILQHGAIPLAPHADWLAALLHRPPADLGTKMIALDQALGRPIGFDEAAEALIAGFREAWGIDFAPGALTEAERQAEQQLLGAKYADERWTYGR